MKNGFSLGLIDILNRIQRGENWTRPHTNYPHQNLSWASHNIPPKCYHCSIFILLSTNRGIKQNWPDTIPREIRVAEELRASPWHGGWLKHPVYKDVANEISSPCLRDELKCGVGGGGQSLLFFVCVVCVCVWWWCVVCVCVWCVCVCVCVWCVCVKREAVKSTEEENDL